MTKTIQTALSPLLITSSFCGLGFFEYPLGRPRQYLSCLYFLVIWSSFIYLYYYVISVSDKLPILSWTNIIISLTSAVSMFVNLYRFKELKICLNEISTVDNTLEVLGTPKEYQRLYKWMIAAIIMWIILICTGNILDILWYDTNYDFNIVRICTPIMLNHWNSVNGISGLTWGTILWYIGSRFQKINKHICNLLENGAAHIGRQDRLIRVGQRKREAKEIERYLWIIMHVHLHLSLISRYLNKVFSIQMTLEMASLFTILVDLFIDFYNLYIDKSIDTLYHVISNILIYLWGGLFIAKILVLNYICQIVCDKANETIRILYQLSNNNANEELREQTTQFILQIKQREVKFSGMGLFYFGYKFVCKFFKSIVTVLVIVIQLRTSHLNNSATENKH